MEPLALEEVALADLKPHPQNYREHPADQLEHLEASLLTFGVYKNIVIARDNTILAGHGLVESAKKLGMPSLPVRRMDLDPQDEESIRLLVGDNETARLALMQETQLAALLQGLADTPGGLLGTGFDAESLAALIEQSQDILPKIEFPEYDESIAQEVEYLECPSCHHRWPK
jgi:ParB-like chromosome segregation protein Spo0J